ncbi:LOW QUALITY PROTEIN: nodal modulator 1-like, partial [Ctenocephalides felis]|uniref:LOW QUALITY PROTEIN: nodal modulator 1-like n=1 Tax=Ctenocephalides felis TaxID=7515 RepID=UPI000E6E1762
IKTQDILGCGGFIKSHIKYGFSKVEIKLFTKQGSLREKTDCAPNGYYFLPLYDRGEYVLKIYPPPGWSFEPNQVALNVDGKTDLCSSGKDINFVFKGFGITGQVEILGQTKGPEGVKLELLMEGSQEKRETVTNDVGSFYFTPVFPGKYVVRATHPRWSFAKSEVSVTVTSGNTDLPAKSLVIDGFDVQGTINTADVLIDDIYIGIFAEKNVPMQSVKGCTKEAMPNFKTTSSSKYLCYVKSEQNGKFNIKSLPSGTYELVPHYNNNKNKVQYTFSPKSQRIVVDHSSVVVPTSFEVTGITVFGKVSTAPNGKAIKGAEIIIDDKQLTITDEQGNFVLKDFKPSTYEIKVNADGMKFIPRNIQVTLKNPIIPEIFPDEFKVCGQVVSNDKHSVAILKSGATNKIVVQTTPGSGNWCQFLAPGTYRVEVVVDDVQKSEGLQFFPVSQSIDVAQGPVSGVVFSQLKAVVSGTIDCLTGSSPDCNNQQVVLKSLNSDGSYSGGDFKVSANNGKYVFENVLPGSYEVLLNPGVLCFEKTSQQITVTKEKHQVPAFKHTGYSVVFDNSHKTKMTYSNNKFQETISLEAGESKICVRDQGVYTMSFESCHTYGKSAEDLTFDTRNSPKAVKIVALTHAHGIRVATPVKVNDLYVNVKIDNEPEKKVYLSDKNLLTSDSNKYVYHHTLQVASDSFVQVQPISEKLLFEPNKIEFVGSNDCKDQAAETINARIGKVIEGQVTPAIEGVVITIEAPGLRLVAQTDKSGRYKVGPIDGSIDYKLTAEKDSFIFQEQNGNFKAHKLCDITVSILDVETGKSLQGVLLSLSGGEGYRKNLLTNQNGAVVFNSLMPSDYYLRAVMKEYVFEPASKKVEVKEGQSVKLEIKGKRTAFSAFGSITSLNGEPTPNVEVEAVGQNECSQYSEEATTETSGIFRIRGLQPKCTYVLKVKSGNGFNKHIDRWTPREIEVQVLDKDIEGLKIIVFHPITQMDVTAHITASNIDHYKSLRVKLFRENSMDSPLHSVKLENPNFQKGGRNPGLRVMFPRIPLDGKNYFVQLESTLSPNQYKYHTPAVQFLASSSFKHINLDFNATTKASEQDLNQTSMLALPMIILVSLVFFNQQKVSDFLQIVGDKLSSVQLKPSNSQFAVQQNVVVDHREIEQIVQNINAVKKKPKPKKI